MTNLTDIEKDLIIYCMEQMSSDFTEEEQNDFENIQRKLALPTQLPSPPCDYSEVQKYYSDAAQ
jgi:hypothetical protein